MRTSLQQFWPLAILSLAFFSLACNGRYEPLPETGASLSGTVSYGHDKIPAATIIVAGQGGAAQGRIGEDGHYKVDNVPLGEVTIGVNTAAAKGEAMGRAMSRGGKGFRMIDVPGKYQDPMKSGIKTNVVKGENTFDIVLSK